MIERATDDGVIWDIIIIGGGATGLGTAVDAAARGYSTLLLEQSDFAKGTSSRSTKLIHGGVRYLQQGNVALVTEALRERGRLRRNAPHLVQDLPFVVPVYDWWEGPFYGVGLKLYDLLAGKEGFGKSEILSVDETLERIPTIEAEGLRGGVVYYDGQFDDARLAINLAQTAASQGAVVVNYTRVTGLTKNDGLVDGVLVLDEESGQTFVAKARIVVNATGVFCDSIRRMDDPDAQTIMVPSQGVHIVLPRSFLPGDSAIMVPHTDDGRVLFAIPWRDRTVVGTTDTALPHPTLTPRAKTEEIEFLLTHAARYLTKDPTRADVLSVFAGIRPLVSGTEDAEGTKNISREHRIFLSRSGLLTIAGGKWTTYRKMAEDVVDEAAEVAGLPEVKCPTKSLPIFGSGSVAKNGASDSLDYYGSDAGKIMELRQKNPDMNRLLHERLPYRLSEIAWAIEAEMARTVEDVLARRTRAVLLDSAAALESAAQVEEMLVTITGRAGGAGLTSFKSAMKEYSV